jgi:two-component system cell cycle sensor histidine kinase/response regulator CckA
VTGQIAWIVERKPAMEETRNREALENRTNDMKVVSAAGTGVGERPIEERIRLGSLNQFVPLAMVTLDEKHRIISCNPQFEKVFAFPEFEIVGKNLDEVLVGEEEKEEGRSFTKKVLQGETVHGSGRRRRKGGSTVDVTFFGIPVIIEGKVVGVLAIYEDVSEQKRKEEADRVSEERYKTILNTIQEGYYELDLAGNFAFFNDALSEIFGYPREELTGMNIRQTTDRAGARRGSRAFNRVYRYQDLVKGFAWEIIKKDGSRGHVEASVSLIRDTGGECIGFRGIVRDITEKTRIQGELIQTRKFLQSILDSSVDGITTTDLKGRIMYSSPKVRDIIGYEPEEMIGRPIHSLMEYGREDAKRIAEALTENGELNNHEMRFIGKERQPVDISLSASPLRDENGRILGYLGIYRDITEKKNLEAQLFQAQKMEALGTLAGGIAHNFNNLLMGIQGNASLSLLEIDASNPHYERLETIEHLVQSGSKLTMQLLGYAREGRYEVKTVSLNQLVRNTCHTFGMTRKEIRIHLDLAQDLFGIKADHSQIEQVLLNLFVNAADAMPRGGDLFVGTKNGTDQDMKKRSYRPRPGRYVLVVVEDTGSGMDGRTRERAFEPFFTTKGLGKGTGLSSVYGIIKAHGGYIDIQSKEGKGTTFEIFLPASEQGVAEEKDLSKRIVKGDETLLLVDDEDIIIHVGKEILKSLGYLTLTARSGREAVEIYAEKHKEIDMVILDMIMPGLGGGEVYDRMKEMNPGVKVLLSSGYSIDGQATEILERGCNGFIQKPFNIKEVSEKIREILEEPEMPLRHFIRAV